MFRLIVLISSLLFFNLSYSQGKQPTCAPDFALKDLEEKVVKLSDFKGKVVILNFWAMWCPPCRKEIPDLIDLYKTYKESNVQVIGISLDEMRTKKLKSFVQTYRINYPILLGNRKVVRDYGGIIGIPTSFIIDKKGVIYNRYSGYQKKEAFEQAIKKLLSAE
ncbi:MAG: TlpA disulfide reductase family protein [Thermodesulfobacteriota bacterium]|nr:TlpA disulfide reductase family protein [Thermodesulfobacteriota bacterium]